MTIVIQTNFPQQAARPSNELYVQVVRSESYPNRLEHEDLVELSNGMTLEVKWGFGRYQSGETLRLEFDGSYLNVYCAKGPALRLAQVKDNYYISD